jgi:hypothetical protein
MEGLLDLFYYTAAAGNGYDEDGHYLRAHVILNTCVNYTDVPAGGGCSANFRTPEASSSARSTSVATGNSGDSRSLKASKAVALPSALLPGAAKKQSGRTPIPAGLDKSKSDPSDGSAAVLDYLMGD